MDKDYHEYLIKTANNTRDSWVTAMNTDVSDLANEIYTLSDMLDNTIDISVSFWFNGSFKGCRICDCYGGPGVYLDTVDETISAISLGDSVVIPMPDELITQLDYMVYQRFKGTELKF